MTRAAVIAHATPDEPTPPPAPAPAAAAPAPGPSLKRLAVVGSAWTLVGYGASQVVRFASNVALAYLLDPASIGLMAMVTVVMQGIQMFSDLGIQQSVIQDPRGHDPDFVNTAWTMHVARGFLLSAGAAALAWPLAALWSMPQLATLLPVAGLMATISGFASTKLFTLNRELALARLTIVDLATQIVATVLTIAFAFYLRSVWALVWGALCSSALKVFLSHYALPGAPNRFRWEREAARSIFRFGRWIFLSSVLGFFVSRGDRLVLATQFNEARMGVYSMAVLLASVLLDVLQTISDRVLFPVYVRWKDRPTSELRARTVRIRLAILGTLMPAAALLAVFAPTLIQIIYDDRYAEAGWMLRVLAVGSLFAIVPAAAPVYMAFGHSSVLAVLVASRSALLVACMIGGGAIAGDVGMVFGVAAATVLHYPFNVWSLRRYGVWIGWLDAAGFAAAGAIVGLGIWIFG